MFKEDKLENEIKNISASPIFGSLESDISLPKAKLNFDPMNPQIAYRLIKDELLNEGNSRLNLATFCQTYMEDEATKIMAETFDKNAIDKSEYAQTAAIEQRCIDIVAGLWNVDKKENYIGTSTVGSSEACMLGGMAMKFAWRHRAEKLGLFEIYNDGENLPIVCYKLKDDANVDWTLYDLADRLLMKGWQVPAYPLPANLEETLIQRIVCRADMSKTLAETFINDFKTAIDALTNKEERTGSFGFTH